jgi:hypothetical protein
MASCGPHLAQEREQWRPVVNTSVGRGGFLDYLSGCYVFKEDSAPWSLLVSYSDTE